MINHRGAEYHHASRGYRQDENLFETRNDLLILTGSGTGGLEAAVANMSPEMSY
jgi:aspartate aminotransferase-like enzyme